MLTLFLLIFVCLYCKTLIIIIIIIVKQGDTGEATGSHPADTTSAGPSWQCLPFHHKRKEEGCLVKDQPLNSELIAGGCRGEQEGEHFVWERFPGEGSEETRGREGPGEGDRSQAWRESTT